MKLFICCLLLLGVCVLAEDRAKRQASYTFPGPRTDRGYRQNAAPVYVEEDDDGDAYQSHRRQFQAQPVQPQYAPRAPSPAAPVAPAPPPPPVYEAPRAPAPAAPRQASPARRASSSSRSSSSSGRANKYASAPQQSLNGHADEEEEEQGPDPLTLLLQDSQFTCGGKNDGYYADDSVNCQVFHYCVGGAKHSWMCPENTVFHQVHLNCVPDAQDICAQSQKFHFVNEYLYKPIDYEGPNKTARYSQRYYPDGYVVGDPLVAPQEHGPRRPPAPQPQPQHQSYPAPAPAPRPAPRPAPPQQPAYRAPPAQPAYRAPPQASYSPPAQSRPASRPSRPVESYPAEAPQGYRPAPPSEPAPQNYRRAPPVQPAGPPPQAYRVSSASREAVPSHNSGYSSSEEDNYQPPPQARRPTAPSQPRPTAGYAPPRPQYRPQASARSSGGYQPYGSNQAAGVQYDEDY